MDKFLIIRLSSLGDIIHALPAFSALRRHFPKARISWAVEGSGREILDLVPGIDEIVTIEKKRWLRGAKRVRYRNQTALDFQGLVKSGLLAYLSGSRRRVGFQRKNCREPLASLFYTDRPALIEEDGLHVIAKNLRLLSCLEIEETRFDFPLVIPDDIRASLDSKLREAGHDGSRRLLLFNLGAAWETKRWFPEQWAALIEKSGFEDASPLLLWGTETEKGLASEVNRMTGVRSAPFLSLKEVLALVQKASLLVSGDTFALQAACALSVPVVGLFGPTNPRRNGPFQPRDRVIYHQLDCNPCYKRSCSTLECLHSISVDEVAAAVRELWTTHD
jgi:lipopolysaccharide heptosyltransferase I